MRFTDQLLSEANSKPTAPGAPPIQRSTSVVSPPATGGWLLPFILAASALAAALVLFFFDPSRHSFYPFCVLYRTTGLQCPGCGGLRALHHLLHGDLVGAFRLNAFLVLALPVVAWLALRPLLAKLPPRLGSLTPSSRLLWVGLIAAMLFGIIRNLPLGWLGSVFQ